MIIKYNDNELLYLISEKDDTALEIILKKYEPLVKAKLLRFRIKNANFEDFYQECFMILYKCVQRYRDDKKVAFCSYVGIAINYCIQNILKREKDYFYDVVLVKEEDIDYITILEENVDGYCFGTLGEYAIKTTNSLSEDNIPKNAKVFNKKSMSHNKLVKNLLNENLNQGKYKKGNSNDGNSNEGNLNDGNLNVFISKLSNLEKEIYGKHLKGYKACEIASIMLLDITTVYNALKRARIKLKKYYL